MRRWIQSLAMLLVSTGSFLYAESLIGSVTIQGNNALSKRDLLNVMVLKPSLTFSPSQLQRDLTTILHLYQEQGYYLARVSLHTLLYSIDSSSVDIVITVEEGKPFHVGVVRLKGNTMYSADEVLAQFDTKPGALFNSLTLERDIDDLLHRYELDGHPFANAAVASITPRQDSPSADLEIAIDIEEGMLIHINEIQVEGNEDTKTDVVVRETRLHLGESYNHDKVRTIPRRLNRLNIFSSVSEPELYVNSRGGGLLIKVQEGTTNTFDGVAGYVPGSADEGGFFTGSVDIGMRSLFGTGRKLNVRWQREDRFSQELAIRYVEPWVFNFPLNLAGSFFQRQQDTTYVRRMIEFKSDVLMSENLSLGALYNHESVIPSITLGARTVFHSSTITAGVEAQYDSRDDILSPTGGLLYRSDYRIGRKRIFGLPDATSSQTRISVQKISMDFEWYVQTFSRQVLNLTLHGRELQSGSIELGDLFQFGGARTMRGYRENQFFGSRIVWSNIEYRFLLARRSFLFGFFDTGYYFRPGDDGNGIPSSQAVKYGYGVGIRLETVLGNIGVSFALGEGDSFGQGKVHIGLVNDF